MTDNPCIGCVPPRRTATCHATCPEYAAYDAENRERNRQAMMEWEPISATKERAIKRNVKCVKRGRQA